MAYIREVSRSLKMRFTQPREIGLHVGLLGVVLIAVVANPAEFVPLFRSNWVIGGYSLMAGMVGVVLVFAGCSAEWVW